MKIDVIANEFKFWKHSKQAAKKNVSSLLSMNPFLSHLITMSNALKSGSESYRREVKRREKFHSRTTGSIIFLISPFDSIKLKDPEKERKREGNFIIVYQIFELEVDLLHCLVRWRRRKNERNLNFISDKKVFGVSSQSITENGLKEKKLIGFWLEMVHRLPLRDIDKDTSIDWLQLHDILESIWELIIKTLRIFPCD